LQQPLNLLRRAIACLKLLNPVSVTFASKQVFEEVSVGRCAHSQSERFREPWKVSLAFAKQQSIPGCGDGLPDQLRGQRVREPHFCLQSLCDANTKPMQVRAELLVVLFGLVAPPDENVWLDEVQLHLEVSVCVACC
jgi:hypothetical protein